MLKLPQEHTDDEKANGIIAQYLNGNILGLVNDKIADYECLWEKEVREDDPDLVRLFFRNIIRLNKWGKCFLAYGHFGNRNTNLSWNL